MIEIENTPFVVMGDWDDSPVPFNKQAIWMPPLPPRVRGAGWNTDTKNCIATLVEIFKPGMSVLDLGTGSGIILVAAFLLGASPIYATEHHQPTLLFAQRVIDLNGIVIKVVRGHEDLPHVDICVANVGADYALDIRHTIKADRIITAKNEDGETVIYNA